ncbi:MAG TPA: YidC/Oxa1 family membrane protein insertase [Candidatus Absconditabacterales bacterium]|nr:YidC/Oxa1 family membrane protein insertase [Candidatus Absconditabacterales bacterium]
MKENLFAILGTQLIMRPIFNLLVVFLAIFGGNLGLAVIVLTLVIRFAMIRITSAGNQMQSGMGALQPKLEEIQEKYKDDPKKLSEETMKVFKKEGKGPLKGCLMMFVQLPVFIGLFYTVRKLSEGTIPETWLYSFFYSFGNKYVSGLALDDGSINHNFLGMDLLATKNIVLTAITVIFTYLQMKLTNLVKPQTPAVPGNEKMPDMSKMMGMMTVFMVFMIGTFVYSTYAVIGIYITTTTLFSVAQYAIQYRSLLKAKRLEFRNKPQIIGKK